MRIYRDQSGTHTALKNQLHQKYSPEYWTGVVQPGTGIATISLMDMYAHLYANYGQVTEGDLEKSRSGITAQFEFATLPKEQYLFKVQKCQELHGNALPPRPITDMEAMGIADINLQRSDLYPFDCREWEMRPSDHKTFPCLRNSICRSRTPPKGKQRNGSAIGPRKQPRGPPAGAGRTD